MKNGKRNPIEHYLNPLHIKCRLVELGISKRIVNKTIDVYEHIVRRWLYYKLYRKERRKEDGR